MITCLNGPNSMLHYVDSKAQEYGLPRVSDQFLYKKHIKIMIKRFSDIELYKECYKLPIVISKPYCFTGPVPSNSSVVGNYTIANVD